VLVRNLISLMRLPKRKHDKEANANVTAILSQLADVDVEFRRQISMSQGPKGAPGRPGEVTGTNNCPQCGTPYGEIDYSPDATEQRCFYCWAVPPPRAEKP
jgi:hypothetical protein